MAGFGKSLAILSVVVPLAAILRFDRARLDSLTFDELWHVELSTGHGTRHMTLPTDVLLNEAPAITSLQDSASIPRVWTNMSGAVHPPLFVLALRIWREICGPGDFAARSLSVLCALGAIVLLYDAVKTLSGMTAARWAAALLAISAAQIYLSQQVRGYAMAQLFGCAALSLVARIQQTGATRRRMVILAACLFAMSLTHYFAIPAAAMLALYALAVLRGKARLAVAFAFVAAGVAFCICWLPFLLDQRKTVAQTTDWWLIDSNVTRLRHVILTLGRAAAIPVRQIAEPTRQWLQWPLVAGAIFVAGAVLLSITRRNRELCVWIFWLLGTLGFVAILDLIRQTGLLVYPRYTALAAPAICAIIASVGARSSHLLLRHALPAIAVAYALTCIPGAYGRDNEPEWLPLGQAIDQHCDPAELLLFYSGGRPFWFHEFLYLGASHYSHQFPRPVVRMTHPLDPDQPTALSGRSVWLISGPLDRPIDQIVPGAVVIEQYAVPTALLTRVTLPPR